MFLQTSGIVIALVKASAAGVLGLILIHFQELSESDPYLFKRHELAYLQLIIGALIIINVMEAVLMADGIFNKRASALKKFIILDVIALIIELLPFFLVDRGVLPVHYLGIFIPVLFFEVYATTLAYMFSTTLKMKEKNVVVHRV